MPTLAIVLSAAAAAGAIATLAIAETGWSEHGFVLASRYTARLSFYWFIAAWSASSLAHVWKGGWRSRLLARRRAVGLGFAAAHGVHFVALFTAIAWFGHQSGTPQIVGGGIGYVFIAAMALTSNNASIRVLGGKRWRLLHVMGGWIVFAIFLLSYVKSLASKPYAAVPALILMTAALTLRVVVKWQKFGHRRRMNALA